MMTVLRNLLRRRHLLLQFISREIVSRYKGSYLGLIWMIVQPLVMLAIYSFVFTTVFKVKWGTTQNISNLDFALVTFAGLIVFQIFSEPMYRSTTLLAANSNFVKRVVFPLEILPTAAVLSAFVLNLVGVCILLAALWFFGYAIGWHLLLLPIVLLPLLLFTLGLSYLVTALGVYFRDLGQAMSIIMNILFYISPVFYPITAVPDRFQVYMHMNPFTGFIEAFRAVTIYNDSPQWGQMLILYVVSIVMFVAGAFVFTSSKETFSDVI